MEPFKTYTINKESELDALVKTIDSDLEFPLVLFIGELGAGKTTFIKALIKYIGTKDVGSSPSYSIINQYKNEANTIYHIDLYRLNNADEAFQLGLEEILYSGNACFIEWPQIIMDYLEEPYQVVKIEVMADNSRKVELYKLQS